MHEKDHFFVIFFYLWFEILNLCS